MTAEYIKIQVAGKDRIVPKPWDYDKPRLMVKPGDVLKSSNGRHNKTISLVAERVDGDEYFAPAGFIRMEVAPSTNSHGKSAGEERKPIIVYVNPDMIFADEWVIKTE